jgi:NAD(P)H-dependent FMN reductase
MIKIIGTTGSLRSKSFNTALLHAAIGLAPSETALESDTQGHPTL